MKKIKIIFCGIALFLMCFSLNSCLKNGAYFTDFASVGPSVDLPLAAKDANGVYSYTFGSLTGTFPIFVNLASPAVLGTSVPVKLIVDTAYLDQYNTANGTSYVALPDSAYTLSNGLSLTIAAGQRLDSTVLTIDFTKVNLSQTYVLPISIASSSVPIEQWSHLLLSPGYIPPPNMFDGEYNVTGSFTDLVNPSITDEGIYPIDADLITLTANSNQFYDKGDNLYGKLINSAGSFSYYGGFDPVFTIDPSTGNVTGVANFYPASDVSDNPHARTAVLDNTVTHQYDLTTKTMTVSYYMYQGDLGENRAYFQEVYTYIGPR